MSNKMKKKANADFGSTAISMTYGEYLAKFPKGRKNESANKNRFGYCIIDNSDPANICWITVSDFNMYQWMHEIVTKGEAK